MVEKKLGGVDIDFSGDGGAKSNTDPYIIALFAEENSGKTRFCMTGPELIGCVPLEMKAYKTIDKDAAEFGKRVVKPRNPMDLIVKKRAVDSLGDDAERQKFYMAHLERVNSYVYALLEHPDIHTVMIDKFTTYCTWMEFAVNGMTEKFVKVGTKVFKARGELNQAIIDFLNSLSQYGKTVILTNASKKDYDMLDGKGEPMRNTWESFKFLGSHCNLVCELVDNKHWNPDKEGEKYDWHYGLNVRRCQDNSLLEGPQGQLLLRDDMISLAQLVAQVDPNADIERYM